MHIYIYNAFYNTTQHWSKFLLPAPKLKCQSIHLIDDIPCQVEQSIETSLHVTYSHISSIDFISLFYTNDRWKFINSSIFW